jgi:NAD(P)-dependent dehydrogenase (short-subunit alcohol dehydrogenase family)
MRSHRAVLDPLQPSGGQPADAIPSFGCETPMKRAGRPAEIAPVRVLVTSQESRYITGEVFGVTGGNTCPDEGACRLPLQ